MVGPELEARSPASLPPVLTPGRKGTEKLMLDDFERRTAYRKRRAGQETWVKGLPLGHLELQQ